METERILQQGSSDKFVAATAAAGMAIAAARSGMGILTLGIERADALEEYTPICTARRRRGVASTLRFLVAGEAAQVALNLSSFSEVDLLCDHHAAGELLRNWSVYWEKFPHFWSTHDDWSVDEVEEEIVHLIWLARWQVRRRFRYEPELSAIEALALKICDGKTLSGKEAERFIRAHCRAARSTVSIPILPT